MTTAPDPRDPVLPVDDAARALARDLLRQARHAALGVIEPANGTPFVSRIALVLTDDAVILTLISALSLHTRALQLNPDCGLLIGEPGPKGDPLTHPRLSLRARATFVPAGSEARASLRAAWLTRHPKAKLYVDFGDFHFVRLAPVSAALNGGFGRAYAMTPFDLGLA